MKNCLSKCIFVLVLLMTLQSCTNPADEYVTVHKWNDSSRTRVVKVSDINWSLDYYNTFQTEFGYLVASPEDAAMVQRYLISANPNETKSVLQEFVSTNYGGKLILHCRLSGDTVEGFKFQFVWCTDGVTTIKEQHGIVNAHLDLKGYRWNCWSGFCYYNDPVGWRGTMENPVSGTREWFKFEDDQLVGMIELPMLRLREAMLDDINFLEVIAFATDTRSLEQLPTYELNSNLTPDWAKSRDNFCFDQENFASTRDIFMPPIKGD